MAKFILRRRKPEKVQVMFPEVTLFSLVDYALKINYEQMFLFTSVSILSHVEIQ